MINKIMILKFLNNLYMIVMLLYFMIRLIFVKKNIKFFYFINKYFGILIGILKFVLEYIINSICNFR